MKKKLLAVMMFLGLAFAALFTSPILSNASSSVEEENQITTYADVPNTPFGVKYNGVKSNVINSGNFYELSRIGFDYYQILQRKLENNVFIAPKAIPQDWLNDIMPISSVSIDFGFYSEYQQEYNSISMVMMYERYGTEMYVYKIVDDGSFDQLIEAALEDYFLEDAVDFIFTDYTWYEIDTIAPTIGGTTHVSFSVDNQPSINELLSHVYAYDETDGYVNVVVDFSTYIQGEMQVGDYYINISASDSNNNKSTSVIYVHRYDDTSPTISGTNTYNLNYDHDLTLEKIESALSITDNVDSGLTLEKVSDTFTGYEHVLGTYQVVYRSVDLSENYSANYTINITIENKGFAVISGPAVIKVGTDTILTLEEFKSQVSVIDGYDGTITNYVVSGFDDYTSTSKITGKNVVRVSYTNSGLNESHYDFPIEKEDKISPTILFDDYFIILKQGETFTHDMILTHVASLLKIDSDSIETLSGEYDTNEIGDYELNVKLTSGENRKFRLRVVDDYDKEPIKTNWVDTFFSTNGYVDNLLKPLKWNAYHYLTIVGIVLLLGFVIVVVVHKKRKKNFSYYD